MKIKTLEVKNFRLLKGIDISLENRTTIVVGRNNSGKTSLAELFRRLLSQSTPAFRLEGFSLGALDLFLKVFKTKQGGAQDAEVRGSLPVIWAKAQ
jgi:predicted ATP-dependent endonuclease of OLD family